MQLPEAVPAVDWRGASIARSPMPFLRYPSLFLLFLSLLFAPPSRAVEDLWGDDLRGGGGVPETATPEVRRATVMFLLREVAEPDPDRRETFLRTALVALLGGQATEEEVDALERDLEDLDSAGLSEEEAATVFMEYLEEIGVDERGFQAARVVVGDFLQDAFSMGGVDGPPAAPLAPAGTLPAPASTHPRRRAGSFRGYAARKRIALPPRLRRPGATQRTLSAWDPAGPPSAGRPASVATGGGFPGEAAARWVGADGTGEGATSGEDPDAGTDFEPIPVGDLEPRARRRMLDPSFDLKGTLLDLEVVPGINTAAKYRWGVDDIPGTEAYTRIDEWRLRGGVDLGDVLDEWFDSPFSVRLSHDRRIILARQFGSALEGARARPVGPLSLPLDAAKARALPMGHLWSLPIDATLVTDLAPVYDSGIVSARAYKRYLVRGRLRMNLFKESENRARVQLVAVDERGRGVGGRVRLVDLFGLSPLDLTVLDVERERRRGEGFVVDYAYDLDDPEAAAAYEAVVRATLKTGRRLAARIARSKVAEAAELRDAVFQDLRPTEALFLADRDRPDGKRRVDRRAMASNLFEVRGRRFKFRPLIARFENGRRFAENRLRIVEADGREREFLMPHHAKWTSWRFLESRGEAWERQVFGLAEVGPGGAAEGPQGLTFSIAHSDRRQSARERRKLLEKIGEEFGGAIAGRVGDLPGEGKERRVRVRVMVALHPEAMARVLDPARRSGEEVAAAAARTAAVFAARGAAEEDPEEEMAADLVAGLEAARRAGSAPGDAAQIHHLVERWGSAGVPGKARTRFLLEVLGADVTPELTHVELEAMAEDGEPVHRKDGFALDDEAIGVVRHALAMIGEWDPFGGMR